MTEHIPASIRYKNPGAMWPGDRATKWGSKRWVYLNDGTGQGGNGKGNKIAIFDSYADGIAAQLDLWRTSPNYRNKKFEDAIAIWSGHNHVESYIKYVLDHVPGMTRETVMNDNFWKSGIGRKFLKAQAGHEAGVTYPAEDNDWIEGQRKVFDREQTNTQHKKAAATVAASATTTASSWSVVWNTFEPWVIGVALLAVVIATGYTLYRIYRK